MIDGLLDQDYIGVDSEWRPVIARNDISRPALFQLSSRKAAFLVDLIGLSND